MRIAQVAPPWLAVPPRGYGGIEWVVALAADGLVERGHDVTLFATGDSVTKAKLEYVVETAPGPPAINSIVLDTTHTLKCFEDPSQFDVYHVHTPFSALTTGIESGVPVVHTLHGSFTDEMRDLYGRVGNRGWFVAISEAQKNDMPELNYGGVVYNGIDIDLYPLREKKEDYLLFLGRAARVKGLRRAVETALLTGDHLVVAVKVANEDEFDEWAEVQKILPKDTEILYEIPLAQKNDLIANAKAVLFPIDWMEPFGLVMTESMACGTPVIATPRGSVPEVIVDGKTGFIVSVENYPEEAAAALQRLGEISPTECRAHVQGKFSKEAMVEGYEKVFERAIGK
jgi:glycosyltransferase involved in cell wall biosynthesis